MTHDKKSFAALLNGREYGSEMPASQNQLAKESGLVVVFGYSDDNAEIRGCIKGEVGCCDGGDIHINRKGVVASWEDGEEKNREDAKAYFEQFSCPISKIKAIWCPPGGGSWAYETTIPHETFEIMEDGDVYCRGIVFDFADIGKTP